MKRRERALTASCDHNVMFAYTYRITTAAFRAGWPRDFASPAYVAHLDGTFAEYYFDAYDTWSSGRGDGARGVADRLRRRGGEKCEWPRRHVARHQRGHQPRPAVRPRRRRAGSARRLERALADYNLANQVIVDAQNLVLDGAARRFDPEVATVTIPGLFVGEGGFLALIAAWRGEAWSRAEQLAAATTPAARQLVVDQIEGWHKPARVAIAAATAYLPFVSSTDARDRFCRDQG